MRRLRIAAGLSQEAAADLIGVARSHAGNMERGQQNITLLIVSKVAQALGCDPAELLDRAAARSFAAGHGAARVPRRKRAVKR